MHASMDSPARTFDLRLRYFVALERVSNSASVSVMAAPATFSSRWPILEVPGIGRTTGERLSSQARASCAGDAPCSESDLGEWAAFAGEPTGGERKPRDGCDVVGSRPIEEILRVAAAEVVEILHGGDRRNS